MKRIVTLILAVLLAFSMVLIMSGCDIMNGTNGLEYYLLPDGTYGVTAGTALYLEDIEIPEKHNGKTVTRILPNAFSGAPYLKTITIPDSVASIDKGAFYKCVNLSSVVIPDGITTIEENVFYGCKNLESVTIPTSVTYIDLDAFSECMNLATIRYPGTEQEWDAINKHEIWCLNLGESSVGITIICHCTEEIEESPDYGHRVGKLCYDYELSYVNGDGTLKISDLRGKVVVINFWGTWCTPCIQELPHFDAVASEYPDEVVVVTIHSTEGLPDAPSFIAQYYPDSAMLFTHDEVNPSNPMTDDYYTKLGGKGAYPMTLILDENGVITFKRMGSLTAVELENAVSIALGN